MRQQDLYLNQELSPAERRAVQRRVLKGELHRIAPGVFTPLAEEQWPGLLQREKLRFLASQFPDTVVGYRSAFEGTRENLNSAPPPHKFAATSPQIFQTLTPTHSPSQSEAKISSHQATR